MERKKRLQLSKHRRAVAKCARLAQRRMSLQQHQPATWSFWILSISPFSNLNLLTTLNGKNANLFELLNENLAPHVSYYLRFATHWVRAIVTLSCHLRESETTLHFAKGGSGIQFTGRIFRTKKIPSAPCILAHAPLVDRSVVWQAARPARS